jgi:hypothetical protein
MPRDYQPYWQVPFDWQVPPPLHGSPAVALLPQVPHSTGRTVPERRQTVVAPPGHVLGSPMAQPQTPPVLHASGLPDALQMFRWPLGPSPVPLPSDSGKRHSFPPQATL